MRFTLFAVLVAILSEMPAHAVQPESPAPQYFVPASADGEIPSQTYPISTFSIKTDSAGVQTLSFSLPEELVSDRAAPVVLQSTPEEGSPARKFKALGVSADCLPQKDSQATDCKFWYAQDYLSVDRSYVKNFLSAQFGSDPSLLSKKLKASARFLHDPEGVLRLP